MDNKMLMLGGEEAMLLVARIKNDDTDFEGNQALASTLLPGIFIIFNEFVAEQGISEGESPICIDEREAWLLRKYVQPSDFDSCGRPLGVRLLRKIHAILISYSFPEFDGFDVQQETSLPLYEKEEVYDKSAAGSDEDPGQDKS